LASRPASPLTRSTLPQTSTMNCAQLFPRSDPPRSESAIDSRDPASKCKPRHQTLTTLKRCSMVRRQRSRATRSLLRSSYRQTEMLSIQFMCLIPGQSALVKKSRARVPTRTRTWPSALMRLVSHSNQESKISGTLRRWLGKNLYQAPALIKLWKSILWVNMFSQQ